MQEPVHGVNGFAGQEELSHLPGQLECNACSLKYPQPRSTSDIDILTFFALALFGKNSIEELPPIQIGIFNTKEG